MKKGISVIICCYNSGSRLPKTLEALSVQQFKEPINWEIVLVDNASTDYTAIAGPKIWTSFNNGIPLRVEHESVAGLSYARKKGIQAASYSILVFCDDDNWLNPNYLQNVYSIFEKNPSIAACGGKGMPAFEQEPPPYWFTEYREAFALGSQEITREKGRLLNLYGAGLAIKKNILNELFDSGFEPILSDRVGNTLSSAGDTELTNALVLQGFELYYSDELTFFHFMPKARLTLNYLNRLFTSFGTDGPIRNLYYSYLSERFFHRLVRIWIFHLLLACTRLIKYLVFPPKKYGRSIYFNWSIAYLKTLFRIAPQYQNLKIKIESLQKTRNLTPLHDNNLYPIQPDRQKNLMPL